jgi:hypothetical protein
MQMRSGHHTRCHWICSNIHFHAGRVVAMAAGVWLPDAAAEFLGSSERRVCVMLLLLLLLWLHSIFIAGCSHRHTLLLQELLLLDSSLLLLGESCYCCCINYLQPIVCSAC